MVARGLLLLMVGLLLTFTTVRSSDSSVVPSNDVEASSGSTFDKISGVIKGTYHLGFTDYVQTYDAVTTANLVWEEDPDYLGDCHCHPFFPTGNIDWTYRYHVQSESDECTDTAEGRLAAGTGLLDKKERMIVLWDVPGDDTQYHFSGNGAVTESGFINCDSGFSVSPIEFLALPAPDDIVTTTPTFPAAAPQSGSITMCDAAPIKVPRDATRITGSCYGSYGDDGHSLEYWKYEWDLQVAPQPIIFIHGFLGSEIKCGGNNLWPKIPPTLVDMALAGDGTSPAPGACAASVGEIVKTVAGSPIYSTAVDFLNQLSPGSVYFFNWDWRKGPQESLTSLESFIGFVRAQHEDAKVVIMAHSYGGLLTRLYLAGAGNADKVARVITIGTPALGSPKALFPLYAGIETPDFSILDWLIDNDDLHEFARNLTGDYFLYPSMAYGPWLRIDPSPVALDRQALVDYVRDLGGNGTLLEQALTLHASTLDSPYVGGPGDPKFEVVVGTGKATIVGIDILARGRVRIRYGNGDGTVPAVSAARGTLGSANPNKAHTYYSCGVEHVPLPGHPQITDAIDDFLKYGDDIDGLESPCPFRGVEFKHFRLPPIAAGQETTAEMAATLGGDGALSIEEAEMQGIADYLDLPDEKFVITGEEFPEIALGPGKYLQVTPLSEDGNGKPALYGPLNGQVTISGDANGAVVQVDGNPAPLSGDVNCDNQVTAIDALLLVLHAGGFANSQAPACEDIGSGAEPFGDVDCDSSITAMDGLTNLELIAGVNLTFIANCE